MASPRFADARLANGLRLRYAGQGEADGPAVLMLHGYTDSWFSFSRLLPLVPKRWRVIAPSHRGHGESDKPADGYTVDNLADDALQFMDALGLERAHIIGHSMGAFIAPRMAAYAPARVSTLVLIGTAPSLRNDAILGLWDEIKAFGDTVDPAYARSFQTSMVKRAVPAGFMERAIAERQHRASGQQRGEARVRQGRGVGGCGGGSGHACCARNTGGAPEVARRP